MLTFNLKKQWFEKIKSGEKIYEYRVMSDYWNKRLYPLGEDHKPHIKKGEVVCYRYDIKNQISETFKNEGKIICFACGYPKKEDKEKRLYAKIKKLFQNVDGLQTDLKIDEPVWAIEFELIKEEQ